jgi:peptidoglycan/LPS O-acetylase OafA/YrhL
LTGIGPAWSLEPELVFYLLLPVLASAAARRTRAMARNERLRAALAAPALLLVVGIASKLIGASADPTVADQWGHNWNTVFERSFLPTADLFALGMAAAVTVVASETGGLRRLRPSRPGLCALLTGFVAVSLHSHSHLGDRAFTTAMGLAFALLVLYVVPAAGSSRPTFARVLETKSLVYLGVISYSIYLWHQPLIFFLRKHGLLATGSLSAISNVMVVLAISAIVSTITYRLVESPAMRRKVPLNRPEHHRVFSVAEPNTVSASP